MCMCIACHRLDLWDNTDATTKLYVVEKIAKRKITQQYNPMKMQLTVLMSDWSLEKKNAKTLPQHHCI